MAGFSPVGSFPVASVPAGSGVSYSPAPGSLVLSGFAPVLGYSVVAPRVTWFGTEVLYNALGVSRVSWIGAEVLHSGDSQARITWMGVEVLRSIAGAVSAGDYSNITILW